MKREIIVESFEKISHSDAQMQSFKVTVNTDDFDTVMDQNFWPEGVRCRRFYSKNFSSKVHDSHWWDKNYKSAENDF